MINLKNKKILLTGGNGFLGSYVSEALHAHGVATEQITIPRSHTHDLRFFDVCRQIVKDHDIVIHLAAKVGGIGFNQAHPGELFFDNLVMGAHMMEAARQEGVEKFVALGTVCAYPKFTPVPFKEEDLWIGYPEETNAPYGLAKKMMLIQAQTYRAQYGFNAIYLLPVNLYGPRDTFDPQKSHVIPALIKKVHDAQKEGAKYIEVWGTGKASREFLYAADAADGIVKALLSYNESEPVNIGAGEEVSIRDLVTLITELMGFEGEIKWQHDKPDGQPRRKLDTTRAKTLFDFTASTPLKEGLQKTITWYRNHLS